MDGILILAGGSGTRLWPASSAARPKQFLSFGLPQSFLQNTVERGVAVNPGAEVVIVTSHRYVGETVSQIAPYGNRGCKITVIGEPKGRNTAPAILLGALYLKNRIPSEGTLLVLTADHLIAPLEGFVRDAKKADGLGKEGWITVFGVPPTYPHTGFGYIQRGEPLGEGYRVRAFKEKPDAATAVGYFRSGEYYWNSGMFLFPLRTLLESFQEHAPEVWKPFHEAGLSGGIETLPDTSSLAELYEKVPSISVDYAIMEKARRVAMVPASFSWNDVGSWDEVAQLFPSAAPQWMEVESKGNYVYSEIPVALCGVEDLIVVIQDGKALILKKGRSQIVRDVAGKFDP